jgi:hypothetical protein
MNALGYPAATHSGRRFDPDREEAMTTTFRGCGHKVVASNIETEGNRVRCITCRRERQRRYERKHYERAHLTD